MLPIRKMMLLLICFMSLFVSIHAETSSSPLSDETYSIPLSENTILVQFHEDTETIYRDMKEISPGLAERGFTLDFALKRLEAVDSLIINLDYSIPSYIMINCDTTIKDDAYSLLSYIMDDLVADTEPIDEMSVVPSGVGYFAKRYVRIPSLNRYEVFYARRFSDDELLIICCVKVNNEEFNEDDFVYFDEVISSLHFSQE